MTGQTAAGLDPAEVAGPRRVRTLVPAGVTSQAAAGRGTDGVGRFGVARRRRTEDYIGGQTS
ncbi:hypothetical protein F0L68_16250 [Solihabitans fulvus]|uniref:Uncharacterized protein n=1 Tax=Solihabitans fulvus TaxID=1892852 RepID=A0A5B2XEZ0_9PSEU|nr:hypothetical protein [Solihabitans fulvus]KAA2261625.1 hypothetical protein F0L68_16250 [Solihabitans fulvus]